MIEREIPAPNDYTSPEYIQQVKAKYNPLILHLSSSSDILFEGRAAHYTFAYNFDIFQTKVQKASLNELVILFTMFSPLMDNLSIAIKDSETKETGLLENAFIHIGQENFILYEDTLVQQSFENKEKYHHKIELFLITSLLEKLNSNASKELPEHDLLKLPLSIKLLQKRQHQLEIELNKVI
jgi:hypothetical protein